MCYVEEIDRSNPKSRIGLDTQWRRESRENKMEKVVRVLFFGQWDQSSKESSNYGWANSLWQWLPVDASREYYTTKGDKALRETKGKGDAMFLCNNWHVHCQYLCSKSINESKIGGHERSGYYHNLGKQRQQGEIVYYNNWSQVVIFYHCQLRCTSWIGNKSQVSYWRIHKVF